MHRSHFDSYSWDGNDTNSVKEFTTFSCLFQLLLSLKYTPRSWESTGTSKKNRQNFQMGPHKLAQTIPTQKRWSRLTGFSVLVFLKTPKFTRKPCKCGNGPSSPKLPSRNVPANHRCRARGNHQRWSFLRRVMHRFGCDNPHKNQQLPVFAPPPAQVVGGKFRELPALLLCNLLNSVNFREYNVWADKQNKYVYLVPHANSHPVPGRRELGCVTPVTLHPRLHPNVLNALW